MTSLPSTTEPAFALPADRQSSPSTPPHAPKLVQLEFTGTTRDYLRIYVSNALLTLLTLGIYSAWAKVRSKRYFYRNTWLGGASFDYLAEPRAILKGRIIAACALLALYVSEIYTQDNLGPLSVIYLLAIPWFILQDLAFHAHNTALRNVRFVFHAGVLPAYALALKCLLLCVFSLGLALPYAHWCVVRFVASRHSYGDQPCSWETPLKSYFYAWAKLVVLALLPALPSAVFFFELASTRPPAPIVLFILGLTGAAGFGLLFARAEAAFSNLRYGGLRVGSHAFSAQLQTWPLFKLASVNVVAILFSLGLLIPWAAIRTARYRTQCIALRVQGEFEARAVPDRQRTAVGAAFADFGELKIGSWT